VFQSPIDRMLRVGTIDFDTASDDPTDRFSFSGVDEPQSLRERILRARDEQTHGSRDSDQGGLS